MKIDRLIVSFALLLIVTNAAARMHDAAPAESKAPSFDNVYRPATSDEVDAIREAFQDRLRDADSAKFRNVRVIGPTHFVCGDINAKNGMGGYVGWRRFTAFLIPKRVDDRLTGEVAAIAFVTDSDVPGAATAVCKERGMQ